MTKRNIKMKKKTVENLIYGAMEICKYTALRLDELSNDQCGIKDEHAEALEYLAINIHSVIAYLVAVKNELKTRSKR